jgi:hypothetical protein
MTPERRNPLPDDLRDTLDAASPDQLRRLLTDILMSRPPEPTHMPDNGGRLN